LAICEDCKQEMLTAEGCVYTHLVDSAGKLYPRSLKHWQDSGQRCHDCAAMYGKLHHCGCDVERCPKCGGQLISCDCDWKKLVVKMKR